MGHLPPPPFLHAARQQIYAAHYPPHHCYGPVGHYNGTRISHITSSNTSINSALLKTSLLVNVIALRYIHTHGEVPHTVRTRYRSTYIPTPLPHTPAAPHAAHLRALRIYRAFCTVAVRAAPRHATAPAFPAGLRRARGGRLLRALPHATLHACRVAAFAHPACAHRTAPRTHAHRTPLRVAWPAALPGRQ